MLKYLALFIYNYQSILCVNVEYIPIHAYLITHILLLGKCVIEL